MKSAILVLFVVTGCDVGGQAGQVAGDQTITRVVKLLQGLLDKSKAEGENERQLFAKHKCYCDSTGASKTQEVSDLTKEIELIGSKIQELQGSSGALSERAAQLVADIAANEQLRTDAETLRGKEKETFDKEEADLTGALDQLRQAIEVLAAIGSDQTAGAAADHAGFMSNYNGASLLKLRANVNAALLAAKVFLSPAQQKKVESFVQTRLNSGVPFNSFYTAQSGEVIGILKQMRDTFASNLESARTTEQKAVEAHANFMKTKLEEHDLMSKQYSSTQTQLASNDGDLSTKKGQLEQDTNQKASAEEFLAQLQSICSTKASEYETRTMLRANEEAALAQAIAILNSDAAFASFGKVKATSVGGVGFLQLRAVRRHKVSSTSETLSHVLLARCKSSSCPPLFRRVVALLQVGNPFETVLAEIQKMQATIAKEAALDEDQLNWCITERTENSANFDAKNTEIGELNAKIESLIQAIEDPIIGLKKNIEDTETSMQGNTERQKQVTDDRRADNTAYKQNIANIVEAKSLLTEAISVLTKYYKGLEESIGAEFTQQPAPPSTWDGKYSGQSTGSQSAIAMLQFILEETQKEETVAHDAEASSQRDYEDSMQGLKSDEATLQTSLVTLKEALAGKQLELQRTRESLDVTTREKVSIERYLLQIKPGCDFITSNFDLRQANREQETEALTQAVTLLKDTPAFKSAVAAAEQAKLGDCSPLCQGTDEADAKCKACLAGVSVPGYCAGHPGTPGC